MARGDSYQLQGQQGGVYLSGAETATGNFRIIHALTTTVIAGFGVSNIKNTSGNNPTSVSLAANTQLGGQFTDVALTSGTCICYYA